MLLYMLHIVRSVNYPQTLTQCKCMKALINVSGAHLFFKNRAKLELFVFNL